MSVEVRDTQRRYPVLGYSNDDVQCVNQITICDYIRRQSCIFLGLKAKKLLEGVLRTVSYTHGTLHRPRSSLSALSSLSVEDLDVALRVMLLFRAQIGKECFP